MFQNEKKGERLRDEHSFFVGVVLAGVFWRRKRREKVNLMLVKCALLIRVSFDGLLLLYLPFLFKFLRCFFFFLRPCVDVFVVFERAVYTRFLSSSKRTFFFCWKYGGELELSRGVE